MDIFLVIIFLLLLMWIITYIFKYNHEISNMVGMVISMALGMITGISIGTLLIIFFPSNFFEITIISLLIGGVIGVVGGLPFSLAIVVSGFVSGIMGGMMGTMLGIMVPTDTHNIVFKIIGLLCVGTLFLIYLMIISEINNKEKKGSVIIHPLPYFLLVCLFIIVLNDYSIPVEVEIPHHSLIEKHLDH